MGNVSAPGSLGLRQRLQNLGPRQKLRLQIGQAVAFSVPRPQRVPRNSVGQFILLADDELLEPGNLFSLAGGFRLDVDQARQPMNTSMPGRLTLGYQPRPRRRDLNGWPGCGASG